MPIKIASYNVHKCVGIDRLFDPLRILRVLQEIQADIIALQEADRRFGDRAGLLDLEELKRMTGLVPVPLSGAYKSHGWHGNVLLVREAIIARAHQISLPGVEPRGALVVDLALGGSELRIVATHLGLLRRSRAGQIQTILEAIRFAEGRSIILMGDLNEWRLGKNSALQALEPIFGRLNQYVPSFPSRKPTFALDRILATPSASLSRFEVHSTALSRIASDHLPVTAHFDS